jgi:hypothetical protein
LPFSTNPFLLNDGKFKLIPLHRLIFIFVNNSYTAPTQSRQKTPMAAFVAQVGAIAPLFSALHLTFFGVMCC